MEQTGPNPLFEKKTLYVYNQTLWEQNQGRIVFHDQSSYKLSRTVMMTS